MEHLIVFVSNHPVLVTSFVVLLLLLLFTESRKAGKTVTTQQATQLINQQQAKVVDVRERKEFSEGHIVDAINIPLNKLTEHMSELEKFKDTPIIIVDNMGQHASSAGKALSKAGYTHVVRLQGGISGWRGENLPLVKS
ncbi:rhodanese-like domain-containing protein [Zooshikella marina]|uniref:Rhodanese-like domain-containing protein n=1 Tax=Zooshikella ganghwensis TaxID=202772 RepID=A0A4P9VWF2_9GAMM|nr:rhodanese-like domain-containing protein [Zooshikella ganghwensis]MBU2708566.1 rhodanese-like domain-containing protein [Zooshikella ganghwensis]RDH46230.1 rhodanese-like domain-containing protein [Zooshikella ganghwensis]